MISKFVKEQERYMQKDLCKKFECSEDKVIPIIRKLKEFGVLKTVKDSNPQRDMTELVEELPV